ncbi:DNA repair protein RadA [Oceanivirga salmonicida]|uniref:DNA repair protein RadA n=1 Tax=Oceanivirga salmonicida TaxID=1769291 RepID=UPI00082E3BD6|nr:DNA repair protein RadA [Oceanivirga salmonicida]
MAKNKINYICNECMYKTSKWVGKCPNCDAWGTIEEEIIMKNIIIDKTSKKNPKLLKDIIIEKEFRLKTNYSEFDRVLGGGLTEAEVVLVTGAPGIGKSTFLLSLLNEYSSSNKTLYVSGEESIRQIKERADRINVNSEKLLILNETRLEYIKDIILEQKPKVVVIDSIQTIYSEEINSLPASVSQIRECSLKLIEIAKEFDISFYIVGHITKDGKLAGPKLLEHMVDCVISFEGDEDNHYRIVRSIKNRYGSTNEISIFDIKENGINEIKNPSEFFVSAREEKNIGSIIVPSIEGSRVILFEVQSLVSKAIYGYPKRIIQGFDKNRIEILLAILSKSMNLDFNMNDVYINIPGGIEIKERASDLAVILSLISSVKKKEISGKIAVLGELGLRGEVRAVSFIKKRVNELIKLGFTGVYLPKIQEKEFKNEKFNIKLNYIDNIKELVERIN